MVNIQPDQTWLNVTIQYQGKSLWTSTIQGKTYLFIALCNNRTCIGEVLEVPLAYKHCTVEFL